MKKKKSSGKKALPGFPRETPFGSKEEVLSYLSGSSIVCLICGKTYRKLGTHLRRMHQVTCDEYKAKYNIPWTYGLLCDDSSELYSKAVRKRMEEGFRPPEKRGAEQIKMTTFPKRECPFKSDIAKKNLGEAILPKRPLHVLPDGTTETYSQARERMTSKFGSEEHKAKMRARPGLKERGYAMGKAWKGRKQSPEHLKRRMEATHGAPWEPNNRKTGRGDAPE